MSAGAWIIPGGVKAETDKIRQQWVGRGELASSMSAKFAITVLLARIEELEKENSFLPDAARLLTSLEDNDFGGGLEVWDQVDDWIRSWERRNG